MTNASPASPDIAAARRLLETAERESDPEQETHHLEEALILLETVADPSPEDMALIANLRTSHARRLLAKVPNLRSASFDVWLLYFNVLGTLASEVDALTAADPGLAASRLEFEGMGGAGVRTAVAQSNAS